MNTLTPDVHQRILSVDLVGFVTRSSEAPDAAPSAGKVSVTKSGRVKKGIVKGGRSEAGLSVTETV